MSRPAGFDVTARGSKKTRREQRAQSNAVSTLLKELPEQERIFYQKHPHVIQNIACKLSTFSNEVFDEQDVSIDLDSAPREPYVDRKKRGDIITAQHSGQRKLLINEILFLTRFLTPGVDAHVVYAGAAPGSHLVLLAKLFPRVVFHLYDPKHFTISPSNQLIIHRELFTDLSAQELARSLDRCLFISDVRRIVKTNPLARQELIIEDLRAQERWAKILQPDASLLKFVMPYPIPGIPDTIKTFDGVVLTQPWAGPTSSETRLVVTNLGSTREYNVIQYEEVLHYYNVHTRSSVFKTIDGITGDDGCHCHDCAAELFIIGTYAAKFNPRLDFSKMQSRINKIGTLDTP